MQGVMYYTADKQKADRALHDLCAARAEEKAVVLACLQRLRNEVAGGSVFVRTQTKLYCLRASEEKKSLHSPKVDSIRLGATGW